jgi:hypothetical protein
MIAIVNFFPCWTGADVRIPERNSVITIMVVFRIDKTYTPGRAIILYCTEAFLLA